MAANYHELLRAADSLAGEKRGDGDLLEAAYSLSFRECSQVLARIYYARLTRAVATGSYDNHRTANSACHLAIALVGCGLTTEAESFFAWGWERGAHHPAVAPLLGEYCAALDAEDAFPELLRWSRIFSATSEGQQGQRRLSRVLLCRALAGVGRTDEAQALLGDLREMSPDGSQHPVIADIERLLASTAATRASQA